MKEGKFYRGTLGLISPLCGWHRCSNEFRGKPIVFECVAAWTDKYHGPGRIGYFAGNAKFTCDPSPLVIPQTHFHAVRLLDPVEITAEEYYNAGT